MVSINMTGSHKMGPSYKYPGMLCSIEHHQIFKYSYIAELAIKKKVKYLGARNEE